MIDMHAQVGDDIVLAILGNKADLAKQRTVPEEEAAELAESIGAGHHLVSAKTGLGLDLAVLGTARKVLAERERDTAHGSVPGRTGKEYKSLLFSCFMLWVIFKADHLSRVDICTISQRHMKQAACYQLVASSCEKCKGLSPRCFCMCGVAGIHSMMGYW